MTNVSKWPLPPKMQQELFSQFTSLFLAADEKKLATLFDALFSDAEKIMFIKRVAIILMMAKGVSVYAIARSLRVSETTVRAHRKQFDNGDYNALIGMSRKHSFDSERFIEIVEVLLRGGLPSYGKGRWKWLK